MPLPDNQAFRLSPQQKRVWSLQQESHAHQAQCAILIEGPLKGKVLKEAMRMVVTRHDILRATFASLPVIKTPFQCIGESGVIQWQEIDCTGHDLNKIEKEFLKPFETQADSLSATLFTYATDKHILLLRLPALCIDEWTLSELVGEISRNYGACIRGEQQAADDVAQYLQFSEWQNALLEDEDARTGRAYWHDQDLTAVNTIKLPLERALSETSFAPATLAVDIDAEVMAKLEADAIAENVSLATYLLTCWHLLLWRVTKQPKIIVGNIADGRTYDVLRGALGLFSKWLPIACQFEEEFRFSDVLQQVHKAVEDGNEWQEYFIAEEDVASNGAGPISNGSGPVFPFVAFSYQERPIRYVADELTLSIYQQYVCTERFHVRLSCIRSGAAMRAELHYDPTRYLTADMERLAQQFKTLLGSMAENNSLTIDEFEIVGAAEREQILEWNSTVVAYPRDECVHELFERQAALTPVALALVYEEQQLSYGELNTRSNQLAHYLRKLGVGPETRVGLCVERSVEMIVGVLAILKAGGAYVPMDPTHPGKRLSFMLEDTAAEVLLTQRHLVANLPAHQARVVCLDAQWDQIAQADSDNPKRNLDAANAAYVIYTSGSTGTPKGVTIEHRQLCNYIHAIFDVLDLKPQSSFATVSTLAADLGNTALYPALCSGGALHVISAERAGDATLLGEYFSRHQIDVLKIVPSHLSALVWGATSAPVLPEQRLVLGGEATQWELAEKVKALKPDCRLLNHYGPTETTVGVLTHTWREDQRERVAATLPLGQPLANTAVYLLDNYLRPVPIGVAGELYIGGAGVGRGYLNQSSLTAEKYLPDPFSQQAGARLYRSGDLGRYMADGSVEFLGRIDKQIKLRGYRIELAEIETALRTHAAVREAVVVVREDEAGEKRLVGYVAPHCEYQEEIAADDWVMEYDHDGHPQDGGLQAVGELLQGRFAVVTEKEAVLVGNNRYNLNGPQAATTLTEIPGAPMRSGPVSGTELREYLRERVPEYMVPSWLVVLDEFPLTANGKIDTRALPAPERLMSEQKAALRTPTEELVAGIWASVLKVSEVGSDANFFELGGHSLLATQVVIRLREAFGVEVQLRSLFEQPTVSGLAAQIEAALKSEKRRALPTLEAIPRDGEIPLSFAQQRLWFLDQLEPNNPFYNVPSGVRFSGELNIEALERTLSEIVRRHEVLRTSFSMVAGEPQQVISAATGITLPLEDLSQLPVEEREQEAARLAGEEAREPFDLSRGPLLRARLLRLAADEHVLLVTMHHIVSDGWSRGVLIREVSALYEAYCAGAESPLPELEIQYADFAMWQRQWLSGPVLEEQLSYWREQLRDLSTLELPTDRVRPAVQSYRGATVGFSLGREETAALKELSRREGATLFMVLLAAFQVLLSRYSGQSDVVIGTPIANRSHSGTEDLIGFFVNTLALRINLDRQASFQQLVKHVREVCLEAYAYQDVPFEKLVEELQPVRDMSRSPLFQVMLILRNAPSGTLRMGNLRLSSAGGDGQTSQYDLVINLTETDGFLNGVLEYSIDLFERASMERLLEHFQQLLRGLTTTPELPLTQISMLPPAEREQLLHEWRQTSSFDHTICLHELFEKQARQRPAAMALIYEDERMSYGELERRANQLAHHLQRLGVGPEVLVGICLERGPQMVVAQLGVLKAGGAYMPMDPTYPPDRLSFMLEDAAAPVLLTQLSVLDRLPVHRGYTLCLDQVWEEIATESETAPEHKAVPQNLAYVIYTSGSTGKPKGVMITHQSICNHLQWFQQAIPLEPDDRVLQQTSFSFDASIEEFYAPLNAGAQLVLLPAGQQQDARQVVEYMVQQKITMLVAVPTQLQVLLQVKGFEECRSLRGIIAGGEELLGTLAVEVANNSAAVLYNTYGPTETTVDTSYYRCDDKADGQRASVPIGRPVMNAEMYVLDEELELLPIGVPGEICIGGAGLARGYLQRPELTAGKFIPDPFSGRAGARLYRSGDLGRYLTDGNIEYRGRLDQQVKLRGYRIELGEIEAALAQHEAVAQCVVSGRTTESGDKRLVGYVVWEPGQTVVLTELRRYLSERLPDYMIPGQWVVLEELPSTASGKLDRAALPAPDTSITDEESLVGPRDLWELKLIQIWEEVLSIHPIGVTDNFFELGGHSLLAVRLVARIEHIFNKKLPLASLFQGGTIEQLAALLRQESDALWPSLIPIQPKGTKPPLFCMHPAGGNVLGYIHLASALGEDQPLYGLQTRGLDGRQPLYSRIEEMAAHYIEEIKSVQPEGPYFIAGTSLGGILAFEVAQQLNAQDQRVALLALLDPTPTGTDFEQPMTESQIIAGVGAAIGLDLSSSDFDELSTDEQLTLLLEHAKGNKRITADVDLAEARHLLRVFKTNDTAAAAYVPQRYPGRAMIIRATDELERHGDDLTLGWGDLMAQGAEVHFVPGNHLRFLSPPHVNETAIVVNSLLEEALNRTNSKTAIV
jgi:amino acid adenylation domain-containing protein